MSTSHTMLYSVDGAPQQRYQLYHEEKAKGGIALTMFGGSSAVTQDSATATGVVNLTSDSVIPHFQEFADRGDGEVVGEVGGRSVRDGSQVR